MKTINIIKILGIIGLLFLLPSISNAQIQRVWSIPEFLSTMSAPPSTGAKVGFRTVNNSVYYWNGTAWVRMAGPGIVDTTYSLSFTSPTLSLLGSGSSVSLTDLYTAGYGLIKTAETWKVDTTSPNGLATRLFAKTLPTSILSGQVAYSNGSNLVGSPNFLFNGRIRAPYGYSTFGYGFVGNDNIYIEGRPNGLLISASAGNATRFIGLSVSPQSSGATSLGSFNEIWSSLFINSILATISAGSATVPSYRFTDGSGNTIYAGMYATGTQANNNLGFSTKGTSDATALNRLFITSTGNTLIGTTTDVPTSILTARSTTKSSSPFPLHTLAESDAITGVQGNFDYETTQNGLRWYNGTRKAYALESTFARGTVTRIPFFDANGQVADDSNLFFTSTGTKKLTVPPGASASNSNGLEFFGSNLGAGGSGFYWLNGVVNIRGDNNTRLAVGNAIMDFVAPNATWRLNSNTVFSSPAGSVVQVGSGYRDIYLDPVGSGTRHIYMYGAANGNNIKFNMLETGFLGLNMGLVQPRYILETVSTDAWGFPRGTVAQRPTIVSNTTPLRYNTDSTALEYGESVGTWRQLATRAYARSLVSSATWLKPQLEAGDVVINAASGADLKINNLDTAKFGSNILRSWNTTLLLYNIGGGAAGITSTNKDSYHTVLNGSLSGSDGGTGQIIIGGSVVANSSGANFNLVTGYSSFSNSSYATVYGYNASVTADNAGAIGRDAVANEVGEMSLGSDIYTKLNLWAGGSGGRVNAIGYGTGAKKSSSLGSNKATHLLATVGSGANVGTVVDYPLDSILTNSIYNNLPNSDVTIGANGNDLAVEDLYEVAFRTTSGSEFGMFDDDVFYVTAQYGVDIQEETGARFQLGDNEYNLKARIYNGGYSAGISGDSTQFEVTSVVGGVGKKHLRVDFEKSLTSHSLRPYDKYGLPNETPDQNKSTAIGFFNGAPAMIQLARDTFIEDVTLFSVGTLLNSCQELTIVSSMTSTAPSNMEIRFPDAADYLRGRKIIVYSKKKDAGSFIPQIKVVGGASRLYFTTNPAVGGTDPSDQSVLSIDDSTWSDHGTTFEFTCLKIDNTPSYRWVLKQR